MSLNVELTLSQVLIRKSVPGEWSIPCGLDFESSHAEMIMLDGSEKPSLQDCLRWKSELEVLSEKEEYKEKRRAAYPTAEELLEALIEDRLEGRPEKLAAIKKKREEIKLKFPKGA